MLTLFIKYDTTGELTYAKLINVAFSGEVSIGTSADQDKLIEFFKQYKPGTVLPVSSLPYNTETFLKVVTDSGVTTYLDKEVTAITSLDKIGIDLDECITFVKGDKYKNSKYIYDQKGNSGKGSLKLNPNFIGETFIVPNLENPI